MATDDRRDLVRGRPVELLIFGTADEDECGTIVERFCCEALGSGVRQTLFVRTSVGVVFGLELKDARQVVLKAHQPRQSVEFLRAVFDTQSYLVNQGFPCPRPVIAPTPIGNGFASVEELVESGSFADPGELHIREAMASALALLIDLTRSLGRPSGFRKAWSLWEAEGLWPPDGS